MADLSSKGTLTRPPSLDIISHYIDQLHYYEEHEDTNPEDAFYENKEDTGSPRPKVVDRLSTPSSGTSTDSSTCHSPKSRSSIQDGFPRKSSVFVDCDIENGDSAPYQLPFRQTVLVAMGLTVSVFMATLDATIVSTALPSILDELGSLDKYSWVATSYMMTFTAFLPLCGKISDIFGRRLIFLASLATFIVGSGLCGIAHTLEFLIVARAIQGLGSGGVVALVMVIVNDLVPPQQRGIYQALVEHSWVFLQYQVLFLEASLWTDFMEMGILYQPTIGALAFLAVFWVDVLGSFLVVVATTSLLLTLSWGGMKYPWQSWPVLSPLVISIVCFVAFIGLEAQESAYQAAIQVIAGFGIGLVAQSLVILVQASFPSDLAATATTAHFFFRSIGGLVGIAAVNTLLNNRWKQEVENILGFTLPVTRITQPPVVTITFLQVSSHGGIDFKISSISTLTPFLREAIIAGFLKAIRLVWLGIMGMLALQFLFSLLHRPVRISKTRWRIAPKREEVSV
ncbi:major facilitator superfamily domain-containing protein [Chytridium lagenaria]|nr:major facilitator superfamily domain-containing protein [Chytridium lagenaria]